MQPRNMSMSGVVDLAAVKAANEAKAKAEQARAQRQDAGAETQASPLVIEVTEATFESDVLQRSAEVPIVISFWADQADQSKQLNTVLERLARQYRGRFVLGTAEVYANQSLFQQFGVQGVPAVFAILAGQAMPLFQGAAPEDQIAEVLDQLIAVAEERFGIVGPEVEPGAVAQEAARPPRRAPPLRRSSRCPPPMRRWTPATWAAPSRRTAMCCPTSPPTWRPNWAWHRRSC